MALAEVMKDGLEDLLSDWQERLATKGSAPPERRIPLAAEIVRSTIASVEAGRADQAAAVRSIKPAAQAYAAACLAEGTPLDDVFEEYLQLKAAMESVWRASGSILAARSMAEDLIELQRALDASLQEACRYYIQRIEDARELLNGILAHDLRTPLSSIMACAEVLVRDPDLNEPQAATAARIHASGGRIQGMVEDVLDFTRTRLKPSLPIVLSWTDVGELARDSRDELTAFNPTVSIRCQTAGDLMLRCDPARVQQLICNLLSNAVQHGARGTTVTLVVQGGPSTVSIRVHNLGPPIPVDKQNVIFYPLFRATLDNPRSIQSRGLGLGLYISREIAEAHQGRIECTSTAEEGTTFGVTLPRRLAG